MAGLRKAKLRDLVELGKEHGYLTLEEMGIEVVDRKKFKQISGAEKEAYTEEWTNAPDVSNSIRMYLSEMGKVPLLKREEEIMLARNVREWETELRLMVLESPITMREIQSWETLIEQEEMTPKELMPRGRKSNYELSAMRRKMKNVSRYIAKSIKALEQMRVKLRAPGLRPAAKKRLQATIDSRHKEIVRKIVGLNLNQDKIKRL